MLSEDFCEPDGSRSEVRTDRDFSIRALGNPEKSSTIRQHQKRRNANRGTAVHRSRAIDNASERCVSNLLEQLIDHLAG